MGENTRLQYPPPFTPLICAALRGERPNWPWAGDTTAMEALLACAEEHGVSALLHDKLHGSAWPREILQALRARAVRQAMWELRHQQLLTETLSALQDIAVQPILIKGTALAYSIYADPVLRTRGDTDFIIPLDAKDRVDQTLRSLGFERQFGVSGEFVSYQANYTRQAAEGGLHTLDVHWKINNSEVLSRLFTYEQLRRDAMMLPLLGPHAYGPSLVDSLLIACMHRATHRMNPYYVKGEAHHDPDRVIWLADIHLIASRLSDQEWHAFIKNANEKGLRGVVDDSLQRTRSAWHTQCPPSLAVRSDRATVGHASRYLGAGKLSQQWMDFVALDGVAAKLALLRESLFPSAAYMRAKFSASRQPLAWLYLRRAVSGLLRQVAHARRR